jgi:hypothetical protein
MKKTLPLAFFMSKRLLLISFLLLSFFLIKGQTPTREDSLQGFSMDEMNEHLTSFKGTEQERNQRIAISQRAFIDRKYKLRAYDIPKMVRDLNARLKRNHNAVTNCDNIGFENNDTTGWSITGAGATNGISFGTGAPTAPSYAITSGAGLDPFGNFPVVYSGAHSLQLNTNNVSNTSFLSTASRVISVGATGNTFFD